MTGISIYIHIKYFDTITHPGPKFNGAWMSTYIPLVIVYVITNHGMSFLVQSETSVLPFAIISLFVISFNWHLGADSV